MNPTTALWNKALGTLPAIHHDIQNGKTGWGISVIGLTAFFSLVVIVLLFFFHLYG